MTGAALESRLSATKKAPKFEKAVKAGRILESQLSKSNCGEFDLFWRWIFWILVMDLATFKGNP